MELFIVSFPYSYHVFTDLSTFEIIVVKYCEKLMRVIMIGIHFHIHFEAQLLYVDFMHLLALCC